MQGYYFVLCNFNDKRLREYSSSSLNPLLFITYLLDNNRQDRKQMLKKTNQKQVLVDIQKTKLLSKLEYTEIT